MFKKKHYSLNKNNPIKLTTTNKVVSDNFDIKIKNGFIYTNVTKGKGILTEVNSEGTILDTCKITIVDWETNKLELELVEIIDSYSGLIEVDGYVYGYRNGKLYRTNDSFETVEEVGISNISNFQKIFKTPLGYIARTIYPNGKIYKSQDLLNWELIFTPAIRGLYHAFDYYFDNTNLYVYCGEYSADENTSSTRHKVYRGILDANGRNDWSVVLEFYSTDEYDADNSLTPRCRHIHLVQTDKYTGDVYVGVGDSSDHSLIWISEDNGDTWDSLGEGINQQYRSLAMWFTEDYIYWNMDTSAPQHIFRLKKADKYNHAKKEVVAKLDNGSMWYICDAIIPDNKEKTIIMGQSAEGKIRDMRGRLYSIQELPNGDNQIFELYSVEGKDEDVYYPFLQLEPRLQDKNGYIYCVGRGTKDDRLWKMRFTRSNNKINHSFIKPIGFS